MNDTSRKLALRLIQVTALVIALAAVVTFFFPGILILVEPVTSRSPYCTKWDALLDSTVAVAQHNTTNRIEAATTLVRTDGHLHLWETPLGRYWLPSADKRLLAILLAQQERSVYGDSEWGVHPGDIVLDCGAHVGVYTRKALAAGAQLVVAIEPTPDAVECLRRNLAEEVASGKVIVYPKGVWDREGNLQLFVNSEGGAGNSFVVEGNKATTLGGIPVTRIDVLVEELNQPRVDFIKADIKGATERALKGATGVITRFNPRLAISTEEPPEDPRSIARLIEEISPGYAMRCGPCLVANDEISTDVIFFRRPAPAGALSGNDQR